MEENKNEHTIEIQMDTVPNILKLDGQEEYVKSLLKQELEHKLNEMIDRYKRLPAVMVQHGESSKLLYEARKLYVEGYYFSCIAMCGITVERIAKGLLLKSVLFRKGNKLSLPSKDLIKELNRIEINTVRELLIKSGVIDKKLRNPFIKLAELRNKYVHSGGENLENDAKNAIDYLHVIIEGTVSVFKNFKIEDGKLVLKSKS